MEIRVQAIHFDMSESLNDFVVKKTQRLARHYDTITNMDFNLRLVKPETALNKEVVAKVLLPQYELVASKTADTFEEATDLAIEALKSQLEKAKNK